MIYILNGYCALFSAAQDVQFTQLWTNPLYLNPSFTGNTKQWRVISNNRTQWTALAANYRSASLSAEGNFDANNSGLGMQILYDQTGVSKLTYVSINPSYAYEARLDRLSSLRFGVNLGFSQRYHNADAYVFASDIAQSDANAASNLLRDSKAYLDMGAGIAFVRKKFWIGASFLHLTRPNYALGAGSASLPIKMSAHTKFNVPIKKTKKGLVVQDADVMFNYKKQGEWDQIDALLIYNSYDFSFGAGYRGMEFLQAEQNSANVDALYGILGYTYYGFKVFYSYDLTISGLSPTTGGSHEISLVIEYPFKPEPRKRSMSMIPCPKW